MVRDDDKPEANEVPKPAHRPLLTSEVTPAGGRIKVHPEDFVVEELPAYQPAGEGQHVYLWVQKRDLDARGLVDTVADRLDVRRADIGTAGLKDRRAITRQWVSVPADQLEEQPQPGPLAENVEIRTVSRHRNKLRTGHLDGNRFEIRVRQTELTGEELKQSLRHAVQRIETEGLPNYFGLQRFGNDASTLEAGWNWLTQNRRPRQHFLQKMAASALQAEIFNRVLARRLTDGSWKSVIDGDIFEKTDTGGRFWIDESERDETARRLENREIVVTGPMPGSKRGLADGRAGRIEREILAEMGLDEEDFEAFGRRGRGTRRPFTVYLQSLDWELEAPDCVVLRFTLPAGTYATVLLRELIG